MVHDEVDGLDPETRCPLAAHQLLTIAEIDAAPVDIFALAKATGADMVQHEFEETATSPGCSTATHPGR